MAQLNPATLAGRLTTTSDIVLAWVAQSWPNRPATAREKFLRGFVGGGMALTPVEQELLRLQKFKKHQINLMQNGVRLEGLAGARIEDLLRQASSARFTLAKRFLRSSRYLMSHRPVLHRDVVSRAYYSIYHSARAVSFLTHPGDDYEEHDKVANGLPADLPDVELWRNKIKDARLKRNEADYEPYMSSDPQFKRASAATLSLAGDFIGVCSTYLRSQGCSV
jgi:uncharacterized protein (UPF0332 family)